MAKNKKKLVITGSEGLIGKKLAEHFKKEYEIVKLDLSLGHNLTDAEFVEEWFRKNKNLYGMILAHAYNPVPTKRTKKTEPIDISLKELKDYFEVNTISAFDVCRNFIKHNKKGVIINISSLYGARSPKHGIYKNFAKHIAYGMSKAALVNMSKYLATYYAPDIRVNTVVFGGVREPSQDTHFVSKYSEHTPMKRLMHIDETISIFEFLLHEKSTYVTGAEFYVDGGWTAW
ncbi:MAG TPA: SDR family oxidoreductase [Candidatus Paceibacterota bacterium]|nr:SDR family oxidoreductase [Candidatus Paceibacterota bacterium]